ncbi:MAG TPA: TetR/AcrR family transcriptional regulator [Thermoplasmata archaeon]|nr:TetR/AcrR family transcriptional regulator [Thermoplasmata archaeon]
MPRTPEANRATRERQRANLLGAAVRLLVSGSAPLTMAALASEAGVSQGLAYRYFPSKDALFRSVAGRIAQAPGSDLPSRIRAIPGGPLVRIAAVVEGVLSAHEQNPEFFAFLLGSASRAKLPLSVRRRLRERQRAFRAAVREQIVQAQRAGEISADDPDALTAALLGSVAGVARFIAREAAEGRSARYPPAAILLRLLGPPARSTPVGGGRDGPGARAPTGRAAAGAFAAPRRGMRVSCEPVTGVPSRFSTHGARPVRSGVP